MKESDWKIFKQIKEQAIQLFCKNALSEYETIIKTIRMTCQKHIDIYIERS